MHYKPLNPNRTTKHPKNAPTVNIRSNSAFTPQGLFYMAGRVLIYNNRSGNAVARARPAGAKVSNDKFHGATVLRSPDAMSRASVADVSPPRQSSIIFVLKSSLWSFVFDMFGRFGWFEIFCWLLMGFAKLLWGYVWLWRGFYAFLFRGFMRVSACLYYFRSNINKSTSFA